MRQFIYGESVRGASHERKGTPLQDSFKINKLADKVAIISVADGHGSEKCPRSKTGSQIAVNVFNDVITEYLVAYNNDIETFMTFLNREGDTKIAKAICNEWQRRIKKSYSKTDDERPYDADGKIKWESVYELYGTTLLGMLIIKEFVFAFQIGDGDMVFVDEKGVENVIEGDKLLGVETHSLSKKDAWKKAITKIYKRESDTDLPYLYMISTDGFSNSYSSTKEYEKTCMDYFNMIQEHGFETVSDSLEQWLKETSELGCGDDITVVLGYFTNDN